MATEITVQTVKAGRTYRVRVNDRRYTFMADLESETVTVFTAHAKIGVWFLSRFDGGLSPASIRKFLGTTGEG